MKASTGWLFSRAISASSVELSMPPERNMPYGTSLRWCRSTLSSSARSSRASAASSSMFSGPPSGRCGHAAAIQHVAVGAGQRLAGQHALDALEDRLGAGGELQLQQFLARGRAHRARDQPGLQQRLRLRGEGQAAVRSARCRAA